MNMAEKFVLKKILMLALTLMVSSVCLIVSTGAHKPGFEIYSAWATSPPTIDGIISGGEWEDAWNANIANTGVVSNVTLYVMNDERYLYLAVDDENDTTCLVDSGAELCIYFDDEPAGAHDGDWTYTECPSGEGRLWIWPGTNPAEFTGCKQGKEWCTRAPVLGVLKAATNTTGHVQYEVAVDLKESPLKGSPGNTFGLRIYVRDPDGNKYDGYWPLGAVWDDPSTYGNFILALGLHERLDALQTDIESLKDDVKRVNATISGILEETLPSIESDIDTVMGELDTINTKIASINETINTIKSDVETIKEQPAPAAFELNIITMVFALVAAVGSIASAMLVRRKT